MSLHSEQHLLRAREENEQSKLEVHNAMALVDAVEKKWGVINIESDDEEEEEEEKNDNTDTNNHRSSKSAAATDASSCYQHKGDDYSTDADPEVANKVKLIQVRNAGESIVHGRYHLHHPTTSHNVVIEPKELNAISTQYSSPILPPQHYIHDDGPFLIQNSMYDVCIFPRGGYGDKVRWCIGLVPCEDCDCDQCCHHALCCDANDVNRNVTIYSDDNNKENNENASVEQSPQLEQQRQQQQRRHHHDRSRNFALAYIYYWMEVDARTETMDNLACLFSKVDVASGESELLVPSWRVCHGSRPLPALEDVTGWRGTKRWWQVWK